MSSDQRIAAVVGVEFDNGAAGRAAYQAPLEGSREVLFPLVKHNVAGITTNLYVQNAGAEATTITIALKRANGNPACTAFVTMKPGRAYAYDAGVQQDCGLQPGFVGTAVISSTTLSVVAMALEAGNNTALAYNGLASDQAGTEVAVPLVLHNARFASTTRFAVQNSSNSASANIEVRYMASGPGNSCTQTTTIPASRSLDLNASSFLASTPACQGTNGWAGSATFSSNVPVVANVHVAAQRDTAAYNGFNRTRATGRAACPLVFHKHNDWTSEITLMNVGATPATITCTFSNSTQTATQANVAADQSVTFNLGDSSTVNLPAGYRGSAICTAQPGQGSPRTIVGVVSSYNTLGTAALYDCINY
jgi:hypothetical protein